jgi:hypothetical protein
VIAADELITSRYTHECWITPRSNLREQGAQAFHEPWLKNLLNHKHEARESINDADPFRGHSVIVTTYEAVVTEYKTAIAAGRIPLLVQQFQGKRMALFLDEVFHVEADGEWHQALKPLEQLAEAVILMGGCISRHNKKRVAFLPYKPDKNGRSEVDWRDNETTTVIRYDIRDATREHALIKINFELRNAEAHWLEKTEEGFEENGIDALDDEGVTIREARDGLYTALSTKFANYLLQEGVHFWRARQVVNKRSKLIIVCNSIGHAKKVMRRLIKLGVLKAECDIVTSENSDAALEALRRFRGKAKPELPCIVTVGMVS